MGESFVDFLVKKDGINAVKEAVPGTLLVDKAVYGRKSYIERLKTLDRNMETDVFVCQLSTNDATMKKPLGEISESYFKESFNTNTVAGAVEYIIAYAKENWNCPIVFFTGTKYTSRGHEEYEKMVEKLSEIAKKWNIVVLDLWNDKKMNSVSEENYSLFMADGIHPTRAGYKEWWMPEFEICIVKTLKTN